MHYIYLYTYIYSRLQIGWHIISRVFLKKKSTNQNSAHGIYDEYHIINSAGDKSHEYPGTPGTK